MANFTLPTTTVTTMSGSAQALVIPAGTTSMRIHVKGSNPVFYSWSGAAADATCSEFLANSVESWDDVSSFGGRTLNVLGTAADVLKIEFNYFKGR